ncbi:TetR family transcriptional regulator [Actinosynnema sp. ALI-1.44]|uniref:TetR/AcrR family transcriptional regulator n=1 Tax=Actinosynnema sp. ALI-1.44 TaxID=1933779 RepID=UPI00097CBD1E|nr:TetR family transcriptional regulator [Actinosynnema sp. ALI-1.44]ONI79804.1 TetR family transcriptional regulator [Actinosynnema sp. ALI-1.44]
MDKAPQVGRRERKKAATRQAIADAADVATTTLFKHFPGKEALVFDQEDGREARLLAAVRERPAGQSIVDALREHVLAGWIQDAADPRMPEFNELIESTRALLEYSERLWTRHTTALSAAIADDVGVAHDNPTCRALARFVLEIPALTRGQHDPRQATEEMFDILTRGWRPPAGPGPL